MFKLNNIYFEKWLLDSISSDSNRHLFFDFDEKLLLHISRFYAQSNSINFFSKPTSIWIYSLDSDKDYSDKTKISKICDADLVRERNLNESSNFIVLISKSSKILPCDSILSSSHNYFDSEKKYVEFISKKIFFDEYNFDPNLIEILKRNLFEFSYEKIYQCFSKSIDPNSVLDFFGIIGDLKHLSYNGKPPYFKDFLFKVQDILTNESFSGLETRLMKNNVSNCSLVLNSFKQEGFNSAREFSRNLNNVFLEFTQRYRDCIVVDEWINALIDEEIDSIIEFDYKNSDDIFTVVKNGDKISDKGNKYVLNRSHLTAYLTNRPTVEWSVNNIVQGEYDNLDLNEKDKLLNVKSAFNGNKKSISIINYCDIISDNLLLDFSARLQLLFSNTDNYLNLKRIKTVSIENDSFINFKNEAKSYIESNYKNIHFDFETLDLNSSKLSIFQVKDKSLFENSDLCLQFRLLNKEADFDWLFFQDMQGNFKLNYQKSQEIEMSTCISNNFFKDVKIILKNVSHNTLYLRLVSNGVSEIIIVDFIPDGKKAPLEVNNYFQKMQALNDFTSSSNRIIEIRSREKNIIQSFYLEASFDNAFFPTIFNINFLNNRKNTLPEIIDIDQPLPNDFRPNKSTFESLLNLSEFDNYLIIRAKLKEILSNKLKSFDIKTIDDIDFSEFEFKQLSIEYIDAYYKVLTLNELVQWIDCFYFCEFNNTHNRLDNYPFAIFFSPLNPLVLYQLVWKMNLMKANLEKSKMPNSLSSIIKINSIENWVLKIQPASKLYISIHTNSTLFTGYILSDLAYKDNSLKGILKYFKVSYSQSIGYLSSSQIRSALNKSYSYLSNKTTFNIKIDGKLFDSTTNDSILNWIDEKTNELSKLYKNFNFQVNIFDNREEICYPSDNLLAYYKDECKLDFNWYKGSLNQVDFDLTLITSIIPDVSEHNESEFENLSQSFTYKNLVNNNISKYNSKALYKDIFIRNSNFVNSFDLILNDLQSIFKSSLNFNQYRTLLVTIGHKNSEVLAISSDISNSFILEEVLGKTLWEFSIADYSYQDTGKGDYFLLANEQEIYISNFKKFLNEIDPNSQNIFDEFISYSKKTGLFELKHLISNQNSIKGFIASVSARKILNSLLTNSLDSFIIPYDVFKNRLHKIKSDLIDNNKFIDTQYPDFILVKITKVENQWLIDIRLIEVKYRKDIMTPSEIDKILIDQTRNVNNLFCKLNSLRKDNTQDLSLWNDSLSLILLEMSQFYFNNSSDVNNKLINNFAEAINSEYDCRILQPLLIAVDSSNNIEINDVNNGSYIKIPQNKIHTIFSGNSEFIDNFNNHFNDLKDFDICSDCNTVSTDEQIELLDTNTEDTFIPDYDDSKYFDSTPNIVDSISEFSHSATHISKVILGKDISNREVVYYPKGKSGTPLPNYNVMVTGSSGKGKTQFIKSFIFQNIKNKVSFSIIDFKNDYSDNVFCSLCNLKKINVKLDGIPFNPLIPRVVSNEDSKYYDVSEHINGICSVLASTFGLGDQQEAQLKRAVRDVFNNAGINPRGTLPFDENLIFPSFNEVGNYLESGEKDLEKLYNRLDPLFDLNLFPDKYKKIGFENIINQSNIIKLSDIQNDKIKNAVAKIVMVSAHGFYLGSNHKSNLEKYFVFDEAHRILDTSFVEKFIRECRAFGVGILLSSQQPDDFPDDVLGQLATKVIHGNDGIARLTKKIKALISFSQDEKFINNLKTFEAIVNSQDYNNFIIKTLAWPHLVVLETVANFDQDGITLNDLKIQISDKDIKLSELDNLLNNLILKSYVLLKNEKYFIYKN